MSDHYERSRTHLDAVDHKRAELLAEYAKPAPDRVKVAQLHQHIGVALKLADVHATLAVAQAMHAERLER